MKSYSVYILECTDGSLYTGYAADVRKRFALHCSGKGAKYTRSHKPLRIVYEEQLPDKSSALRREWTIKHLTKREKETLIQRSGADVGAKEFPDGK
ncbi:MULTISPECIES: GIY-YIG nuclease family protein [unclassified Sporolactobacillus]|uniref:GIY-YIG nuclease family protein n=1 Tax=unclassified Sporolactobacillus TaxID=2628533 RepID=UPI0023675D27|nr:GIY-YIG nuclease family protein [Sporolactobacillus sp. CQH2019]MDD9150679.1 GIY-YIG nuclease family protein [Sporolactobacillus sp. CQH2019]